MKIRKMLLLTVILSLSMAVTAYAAPSDHAETPLAGFGTEEKKPGRKPGIQGYETEEQETQQLETEQSETEQSETKLPETEKLKSEHPETGNSETERSENETEDQEKPVRGYVAIDPGHQGSWVDMSAQEPNGPGSSVMKTRATTGTQGQFTGIPEYELNLAVSLMLEAELQERGYQVILTRRDNDTAISNSERAVLANEAGADVAVRIHANGADDSSVNGALAMVPGEDNPYIGGLAGKSRKLGEAILNSYCDYTGMANKGILAVNDMTGINWSKIPVMILEMGYMSNPSDDSLMADQNFREKMVLGIADGIDRYFDAEPSAAYLKAQAAEAQKKADDYQKKLENECLNEWESSGEIWAVSAADPSGEAVISHNGDQRVQTASVIKLFIMAAVYDRVCYPETPERKITYPENYQGELRQLINDMITVSDNTASNRIVEGLGNGDFETGKAVVNEFCSSHGYTQTHLGRRFLDQNPTDDNYTSANDCLNLLCSFYRGTCVNKEASDKMLAFMKGQTRTGKIPAGISGKNVETANKTGEIAGDYGLGFVENDVAIVWGPECDYVLCILSSNLQGNNSRAQERIRDLSARFYGYFEES